MSFILNIDTAVQTSSVCLARNNQSLGIKINPSQKDSAAWLNTAIKELIQEQKLTLQQIDAIAVSEGPGSYTGLRVGMATAKGLCYVLNKPLILVNTLLMMANAAPKKQGDLLCPMIDARRLEVFTAIFDEQLQYVLPPVNLILTADSFAEFLEKNSVLFFGNGSKKFQSLTTHPNASFAEIEANASSMAGLSYKSFTEQRFADLAYSQPFYGKDFYSTQPQSL